MNIFNIFKSSSKKEDPAVNVDNDDIFSFGRLAPEPKPEPEPEPESKLTSEDMHGVYGSGMVRISGPSYADCDTITQIIFRDNIEKEKLLRVLSPGDTLYIDYADKYFGSFIIRTIERREGITICNVVEMFTNEGEKRNVARWGRARSVGVVRLGAFIPSVEMCPIPDYWSEKSINIFAWSDNDIAKRADGLKDQVEV